MVPKQVVRLLGCIVLAGWASAASAVDPWDWTVSAIPNQTYNSQQAAEAALRALGTQYALAEVAENTLMSATGTTYTYGARARGPDIGPWGNYIIQWASTNPHNSEEEAVADLIATYSNSCGAATVTPTTGWRPWQTWYTGDDTEESRLQNLQYFSSSTPCSPYQQHIILQSWRWRTVACPAYTSWTYAEGACVLHSIATIQSKSLFCPVCGGGTGEGGSDLHVGNPSSTSNGDKYLGEADFKLPWVEFRRSYHSLLRAPYGSLGPGWNHSLNVRLSFSGSTPTGITLPSGDQLPLTFVGYDVYYVANDGSGRHLMPQYYWYEGDGRVLVFDVTGKVVREDLPDGQHLTLVYDSNSRLTTVTNSSGRSLTFVYESGWTTPAASRLHSVMYLGTALVTYTYDGNGNLSTATRADGSIRTYLYENSSFPNHLTGTLDENGVRYATYAYDSQGRAQSTEHANGVERYTLSFNGDGTTTVVTPLNETRTYQFTNDGRYRKPLSVAGSDGARSWSYAAVVSDFRRRPLQTTDKRGTLTTYQYTESGDIRTEKRTEAQGTPTQRVIESDYSKSSVLLRERRVRNASNALVSRSTFVYNTRYQITARCDVDPANATAMNYVCGSSANAPSGVRQWITSYCESADVGNPGATNCILVGQIKSVDGPRTDVADTTVYNYYTSTDESGCATGGTCHRLGDLWQVQDALGHITTFTRYDLGGRPLAVTDQNGVVTLFTYDSVGQLTARQVDTETTTFEYWPTGSLKRVVLPDSSYLLYTYDDAHRLIKTEDGDGNRIEFTLDAMGNRTAEDAYDPTSSLARTRSQVFNSLSQLWKQIGAAGTSAVTTTFGYDNNGNQTTINAPLTRNTTNDFDELDRLKRITDPANGVMLLGYDANDNLISVTDPRSNVTGYQYTGFGEVKQLTSPDTGTTTSVYDSAGNLATRTDARSNTATFSYDALNRVTQIAYPDQTLTLSYDAGTNGVGRLTGAADANHSLSWTYDAQGRVISKSQTVGALTKSVGYGYTDANLSTLTTPSGQTITYGYSGGKVTSVTLNGTTTILSQVSYEPFGPVRGWTWGNSTITTRTHDLDGNPSDFESAGSHSYTYDDAFRITGLTDLSDNTKSWTYGYDALDRLSSASSASLSQTWSYDANGNRLTQGGTSSSTYTPYTTSNRLSSVSGALSRTYSYDAAGNTTGYGGLTFTYTVAGRMSSATSSGVTTSYLYNALGQRVTKLTGSAATYFAYDESGHLLGEYDTTGALIEETVWLEDIPVAVLKPNGGEGVDLFYLYTDHLNTPRRISRPGDNVTVWRWDSDAFGTTAANDDPDGDSTSFVYNPRFPGQYYDSENGLSYNYFRDYDPQTGRYMESDPVGLRGGINTYSYVIGNPVGMLDPFGLYIPKATPDCIVQLFPPFERRYGQRYDRFDEESMRLTIPIVVPTGRRSFDTLGYFDVSLHWQQWILWSLWEHSQNYLYICTEIGPCGETHTRTLPGSNDFTYEKFERLGVDRWRDVRYIPPPNNPPTNLPPPWPEWWIP